jgi:HK97 family phage major capsid protein
MTLKELKEKRGQALKDLQSLSTEMSGKPETAETRAKWDKLSAEAEQYTTEISREEQRLKIEAAAAETAEKRNENGVTDVEKRKREVFTKVLRSGMLSLSADESKLIERRAAIDGVAGQVILPSMVQTEVESAMKGIGGFQDAVSKVNTTTGANMSWPTINTTAEKGVWLGQNEQGERQQPTFSVVEFVANTLRTKLIPISLELVQDAGFDITQFLVQEMAKQLSAGLNLAITSGSGVKQPKGILADAASAAGAKATSISFDDLLTLMTAVDASYWNPASFMMNPNTFVKLAKIKGSDGQYIMNPVVQAGFNPVLYGHKVVLNSDMPDIGASTTPIIFGDLSKYKLRIVRDMFFTRLNEILAEYNAIGVYGFMRVDGKLIDAGTHPVAKLTMAAAD